jgi:hypothetical protein
VKRQVTRSSLAVLLGLASLGAARASDAPEADAEAGGSYHNLLSSGVDLDAIYNLKGERPASNSVTLLQHHEWRNADSSYDPSFTLRYRLLFDREQPDTRRQLGARHVEKLIAYASAVLFATKLSAGYQEVTWGESTVMPILDIVNARSLTHPRGFYDPAAKVPAAMLRGEWQGEVLSAEAIAVPRPEPLQQPTETSGFDIAPLEDQEAAKPEYGGRLGVYWQGVDAKAYYFRHAARIPAYRLVAFGGDGDLLQDVEPEDTYGLSASYAADALTLRGDVAETRNMPATGIGTEVEHTTLTQAIVGASWATVSQHTFGLELHTDSWAEQPVAYSDGAFVRSHRERQTLSWLAYTANLRLFDGDLDVAALYYHGIEKDDELMRLSATFAATEQIALGGELQRTYAESRSPLLLLSKRESVALKFSWTH